MLYTEQASISVNGEKIEGQKTGFRYRPAVTTPTCVLTGDVYQTGTERAWVS
jgi:hypothetical protein